MDIFTQLSNELTTLNAFAKQRANDIKKEPLNPEYARMVSPPYERELMTASRIQELMQCIYFNEAP